MESKKQKRYYKVGELVWSIADKKEAKVLSINKEKRTVVIELSQNHTAKVNLWDIDKIKYKAKEKLSNNKNLGVMTVTELRGLVKKIFYPEVFFAKVREGAVIPSKRKEDAGLDIYAELSNFKRETDEGVVYEIECPKLATTLVPTGLATAMPNTHYLNLKHERGSTGVQSMSVLAGVIDSGFRNEMFVALTPLHKSVIITSAVDKVEVNDTHILYPLSKAIVQGTIELVPDAKITEIDLETLQNIPSERGMTMLGQSGK